MSVISGLMGASATESAATKSAGAQTYATDVAKKIYEDDIARQKPFYDAGVEALPTYKRMLTGDYDMKESPSAKYQVETGTKAMNRALASRGLSVSGNAVNRLTELNKSVAASDWNNQYSRILDALKLGTGASASMGASSDKMSGSTQAGANNLANIFSQQGANQASLYRGASSNALGAAAVGIKAYNANPGGSAPSSPSYGDANPYTAEAVEYGGEYGF